MLIIYSFLQAVCISLLDVFFVLIWLFICPFVAVLPWAMIDHWSQSRAVAALVSDGANAKHPLQDLLATRATSIVEGVVFLQKHVVLHRSFQARSASR